MRVIKNPVTYEAEQFDSPSSVPEIERILEGTGVKIKSTQQNGTRLEWPGTGFYEFGERVDLWRDDWVVVDSLGEVRKLSPEEFRKEFSIEIFEVAE